ncbi:MAG: methyltransferase domain-containing protein [Planctomycetes bacterium]|nr:methyltransferase domain-containing protein [Planctomycetota bacterium]
MQLPHQALLACSVRDCGADLERVQRLWRCSAGHCFDVARSGYVNLLQPQDRRSLDAGDSRRTVEARRALLDAGFGAALRQCVQTLASTVALEHGAAVVDFGCGDGHFLDAVCTALGCAGVGLDLSPHAIESAAKRHAHGIWVVANADRRLPLRTGVFGLALSIDGRRPGAEAARVLSERGTWLIAIPADDDLCELRETVLGESRPRAGIERVEAELRGLFQLHEKRTARATLRLDRNDLERLALATYRCARRAEREKLESLTHLDVTTSHDVLLFRRMPGA